MNKNHTLRGKIIVGKFAPTNFDFRLTFTRYCNYKIGTCDLTFSDWLMKYDPRIEADSTRDGIVRQIHNLLLNSYDSEKLKNMLTHMNGRYSHLIENFPKFMDYNQLPKELVCAFLVGYPSFCNSNFNKKNNI